MREVKAIGTCKIQGREMQLTVPQIKKLKLRAFFNAHSGEPKSENEGTKVERRMVVNRYLDYILTKAINKMLDLR